MRILVDTRILLWVQLEPQKLSQKARELLTAPGQRLFFSAASIWEIAIKAQFKRANFSASPLAIAAAAVASGFTELPVRAEAAARISELPLHHGDPFDRLLIAQALTEPAHLLTADAQLAHYSDLVTVV
jgi:PIN domain nuclease of toxin-antitoxin system